MDRTAGREGTGREGGKGKKSAAEEQKGRGKGKGETIKECSKMLGRVTKGEARRGRTATLGKRNVAK